MNNKKKTIIIKKSDNCVSNIILNQPEKHNALSPLMIKELSESFDELKEDRYTKVLIISTKFSKPISLIKLCDFFL